MASSRGGGVEEGTNDKGCDRLGGKDDKGWKMDDQGALHGCKPLRKLSKRMGDQVAKANGRPRRNALLHGMTRRYARLQWM